MTTRLLPTLLLSTLLLAAACVEEGTESFDENPYNSDVTPTGDEKADEAAALTGFIVLGEGDAMPEGRAAIFNIDGQKISEVDVGDFETRAANGEGSLFASPVFSPADGREIAGQSNIAGTTPEGGSGPSTKAPTGELNPFHCNASGELLPNPLLPPCNANARWVTPRVFDGPPKQFAYLLYRLEHDFGDADDEYPYGERTWWGWGNTVELHKAAILWSSDDGAFTKTKASVPAGSRFEYDEFRLVEAKPIQVGEHQLTPVFLRLPLVFTGN